MPYSHLQLHKYLTGFLYPLLCELPYISDLPPNANLNLFYLAAEEDKETLERELRDAKVNYDVTQIRRRFHRILNKRKYFSAPYGKLFVGFIH